MSWFSRNRHWLLLALVAVTTVLAVGTVGVGLVAVLAGLAGGAGLGAVLGDVALVLSIAALLVAADVAFALAFLVTLARRASLPSLPENDRVADGFERAERLVPPLSRLGLADRFAVSTETKRERLKERYVDGDLTEVEYERQLQVLLAEADDDAAVSAGDEIEPDLAAGEEQTTARTAADSAPSSTELESDAE
ncbi:SHOCT domain-containing protein [Halomicrobium mukohataei]|uniref:SHOCT domain-containing protein n=1 Tax=Halomicrobium mukohataei TaxID=57705 RepID=A0A847UIK6_9EURY|nr:SHOCT domain-containing protein [Halomicrobium mukohataei]